MSIVPYRDRIDWRGVVAAFLAEKEQHSQSKRTPEEYARVLYRYFQHLGETTPDLATGEQVFTFVYSKGPRGLVPTPGTIRFYLAILSSFYDFMARMEVCHRNPARGIRRPKKPDSTPKGLTQDEIKALLHSMPNTVVAARDRAIILFMVLSGRRRAEILQDSATHEGGLAGKDITVDSGKVFYTYRGKGNKIRTRELPPPVVSAINTWLRLYEKSLDTLEPHERLFDVSTQGFYCNLQRYCKLAGIAPVGVHALRHTAAKFRRQTGASLEEVSQFLDHSNLATTSIYLAQLMHTDDVGWQPVARMLAS